MIRLNAPSELSLMSGISFAEKNGIFNLILQNYKTLLRNNGFRYRQSVAKVRETIKLESDKLAEFIKVCLIKEPNKQLTKDQMFNAYTKFCEFNGYEIYPKRKFGSNFPTYGFEDDIRKIENKTERVWIGVTFNLNDEWTKNNLKVT